MRILVACEESQAVTIEMRKLGHEAYSCDIQACSGGHPEWHIKAVGKNKTETAKLRSKTFPGIARAMAEQWAGKITK